MKNTLVVAAILAGLAPLAAAQQLNGPVDPKLKLEESQAAKQEKALRATLTGMNDGNEMGELVVEYLQRTGIQVAFATQSDAARIAQSGPHGERTLYVSDALPLYPRVLAAAIAGAAAERMTSDMEPSQERQYMRDSVVARVWIELGGERAKLPVIEALTGYENKTLSAPIERWSALAYALPTIEQQLAEQKRCLDSGNYHVIPTCQDKKARLEADAKRADEFRKAENEWFRLHQGI